MTVCLEDKGVLGGGGGGRSCRVASYMVSIVGVAYVQEAVQ